MTSNVSQAANEAFLLELRATDPKRFEKLARVDRTAQAMMPTERWEVGKCAGCGKPIINGAFIERGKQAGEGMEFCSRACRDGKVVPIRAPLLHRKHATVEERQTARREQDRARKKSLRFEKAG